MCGIFGIITGIENNKIDKLNIIKILEKISVLSESRGKEASGLISIQPEKISYIKSDMAASALIKTRHYKKLLKENYCPKKEGAFIGHSRLVTNGCQSNYLNNQPILKGNIIGVHNGIVVNVSELWSEYPHLERKSEVDSEFIFSLINDLLDSGSTISNCMSVLFNKIKGMANLAFTSRNFKNIILATNNGSIYFQKSKKYNLILFASERNIISKINERFNLANCNSIKQLESGNYLNINLDNCDYEVLPINASSDLVPKVSQNVCNKKIIMDYSTKKKSLTPKKSFIIKHNNFCDHQKHYTQIKESIKNIKRCTKCVLPATIPYINFNSEGICNYCQNYTPIEIIKTNPPELSRSDMNRKGSNCLVALSGGRDSSYGLHYVKKELGLNPIAYTYDWGMVTDLARRNLSLMCGELGVEHILVSADIRNKLNNIKKNVSAWLKQPKLSMVPLFMAGDKQFFYYANKIAQQNNIKLIIFSENLLEKTFFKSGFCGIKPQFENKTTYSLKLKDKIKLSQHYLWQYIKNPSYLNSTIWDSIKAYLSYYFIPHDFLWLYRYHAWNERKIDNVLLDKYSWETARDTKTTWRIGDGTAAFYNYIYYTMAGFSENDTFRSNQIRENHITRDEALKLIERDNSPRFESMQWYFNRINLDMNSSLKVINEAPKLFRWES